MGPEETLVADHEATVIDVADEPTVMDSQDLRFQNPKVLKAVRLLTGEEQIEGDDVGAIASTNASRLLREAGVTHKEVEAVYAREFTAANAPKGGVKTFKNSL